MRRLVCSLLAATALTGCASTSYYRHDGAADYYYEHGRHYSEHDHDGYYTGYCFGYSGGPGHFGYYDPYVSPSFYLGTTNWPYSVYSYHSPCYAGWPYFGHAPWYASWWGVGYHDWSWQRHQRALARERTRNVASEASTIAAMNGRRVPSAEAVMHANRSARLPSNQGGEAGRPLGFDTGRQLRTESVDPYYGAPRVRRGEGLPQRELLPLGRPEMSLQDRTARGSAGLPPRDERPIRTGPAFDQRRINLPTPHAGAPARQMPAAAARTSTPAMQRAPSAPPDAGRLRTRDD
ncbi:MAG: hypothetical protein JNN30_03870 [Rhodanobacteraceae bacterium]|nr:hypothetical protein [Rhodanobacteraceae bacterium]